MRARPGTDSAAPGKRWCPRRAALGFLAGLSVLTVGVLLSAGGAGADVSRACPAKSPRAIQTNSWPRAHRRLAPHGARLITLCRYSGINSHPSYGLVASEVVSRHATIHRLVHRFDALKPAPPGAFSCPADQGSDILAMLAYPGEHQVRILVTLTGCAAASNGDVSRAVFNFNGRNPQGPKLVAELKRLTHH